MNPSTSARVHGDQSGRGVGDSGYALALTALLIIPLLAFTAYAVDLGAWYARADQLQRASDAAALAGAPLLPNQTKAAIAAVQSLAKSGFCTGASMGSTTCTPTSTNYTISMGQVQSSTTRYFVDISDGKANQFFSVLGRPPGTPSSCTPVTTTVCIQRRGTAERIKPVPMGSPRNFLGTFNMMSHGIGGRGPFTGNAGADENYYLSVSGYCARTEHGDKIAPRADANQVGGAGNCAPAGTTPRPNLFWRSNNGVDSDGYYYGVDVATAGTYKVEIYDAADCQYEGSMGGGTGNDSGADLNTSERNYHFSVLNNDSNNPLNATVQSTTAIPRSQCATYANKWVPFTLNASTPGTYFLRMSPDTPTVKTTNEGQNQFAMTVTPSSTAFSPCTNDQTTVVAGYNIIYNANCPKLYALTDLGVYVALPAGNPAFYLASVGPEHAGKTMNVELFDFAEGSTGVQLLDPNNNPVTFTAEIACKDGTYISETGACTTGEQAPTANSNNAPVDSGGSATYGPWTRLSTSTGLDVCGTNAGCTGTQPWAAGLTQNTLYSDRIVRLQYNLPSDYGTTFCPNPTNPATCKSWWKIRLTSAGTGGDRTTWTVQIKGDPVRLVPNS